MIPFALFRALAIHADAETSLSEAVDTWHATTGLLHCRARRDLRTAILAARMARGAVAQARRQAALDSQRLGNWGHRTFATAA